LLKSLAYIQLVYASVFDAKCIKTETLSAETCLGLIGLAGGVSEVIQKIISSNPDLPTRVRALGTSTNPQIDNGNSNSNTNANSNDNTADNQNDNGGTPDDGTGGDTSTGGICGSYPADGGTLPNSVVIYGDPDIYWGQPVVDSDAPIYAGHYVAYVADGFYYSLNDLYPGDVEITWEIDGTEAVLVAGRPGREYLNSVYLHALEAGTIQLCVQGIRIDTGEVIGYRAVPITIIEPPFFIDTIEVWRPDYVTPSNAIILTLGYEGQVSLPLYVYVATVGASCPPETGELPCETESQYAEDDFNTNSVSLSMDLTDRCAEVGTGGTLYYRLHMQDASGAYSRPLDYTYTCIPNP
jgi:hypothetical protein